MTSSVPSPFAGSAASAGAFASSTAHPGKFSPGTKVQVGSHRVIVEKYLSEGGFAHVYVVRVPSSDGRTESAVLKRVAVPDKEALANMRTEVETMKKLKGHKRIVTYIDSHASQLKAGGYEVFLLMEYCDGGGLIDFMNTRLKNRLTEPEILNIFSDAAEGVACMHYLKPPLLHRDLKVENILISNSPSGKVYKLCDFGSSAPPIPAATSAADGRLIEDDIQKHTTLQYRSPEMIDVYQKRPIDEKSDIWALGVLLYKLCYYTTPFEQQGQMAILTASFKYPPYPKFSDRLKKLIAAMLTLDARRRPNIYNVVVEVCSMRGTAVPIKDIYATRSSSEARSNQKLPDRALNIKSPPQIGAVKAQPDQVKQELPEITPMRRGRPASTTQPITSEKTTELSSKAAGKDPFAALDSPSFATRSKAVDELSTRFPSAEQFALLQDKPSNFQFESKPDDNKELNTRATNVLADEAFAPSSSAASEPRAAAAADAAKVASSRQAQPPDSPRIKSVQKPPVEKPLPQRPKMVSTGTMTSDPSSPRKPKQASNLFADRPIWRVPPPKPSRLISEPDDQSDDGVLQSDTQPPLIDISSGKTRSSAALHETQRSPEPVSSRPSLEGVRHSLLDLPPTSTRSRSADDRSVSPANYERANGDDSTVIGPMRGRRRNSNDTRVAAISSNTENVGAKEEEQLNSRHENTPSSLQTVKPANTPSASKPGPSWKFGSALRRFEAGDNLHHSSVTADSTHDVADELESNPLPEQATVDSAERELEDIEDLSQEAKRERERRRLSLEEKRVASAGAAYRQQLINGGKPSGVNRASTIQNRVANLLDESGRSSPVKKTAEGYGRFTDAQASTSAADESSSRRLGPNGTQYVPPVRAESASLPPQPSAARPSAPPKPEALRTTGTAASSSLAAQPEEAAVEAIENDTELEFTKRYPSLSLDMVESEIQKVQQNPSRSGNVKIIRDV